MKPLLLVLLLPFLTHAGWADDFRFSPAYGRPDWIGLQVPKEWEHDNLDIEWYSGFTPDRKVWISCEYFDALDDAQFKAWLPKHLWRFGAETKLDWMTFHAAPGRLGEWNVLDCFLTGEAEDGPVEVTVTIYAVSEKERFVVTTGGPAALREKYRAALRKIQESVRRVAAPGKG
jgi:hypothetical protein